MDLSECVVERPPIAQRFVDGGVETIEEPELELVGALEEVLEIAKGQFHIDYPSAGLRLQPFDLRGDWLTRQEAGVAG